MRNWIIILLAMLLAAPVGMASTMRDDDDKDPSKKREIRRLHPERERAKAIQKLQEQMSRKAEVKDDPWDTSDEVWGTVDVIPVSVKDSVAVEGHNLSDAEGQRLTWRDEPVTVSIEQLMPYFVVEDGEYRSKYVSTDSEGNEVYFAFTMHDGDEVPGPLRLCVRYVGTISLNYDQTTFTIDGYDYTFYPAQPRFGRLEDGRYWASSDDELQDIHKDLVYALSHGYWALIKLQGLGGANAAKAINVGQLEDFANTLALYRLLGGMF